MKKIAIIALILLIVMITGCGTDEAPKVEGTDQGLTVTESQIDQLATANGTTAIEEQSPPQK